MCAPPRQCSSLGARADHSWASGAGVWNAGTVGRWDCWAVLTGLCVDGARWGGRLHLHKKQTSFHNGASAKSGLKFQTHKRLTNPEYSGTSLYRLFFFFV